MSLHQLASQCNPHQPTRHILWPLVMSDTDYNEGVLNTVIGLKNYQPLDLCEFAALSGPTRTWLPLAVVLTQQYLTCHPLVLSHTIIKQPIV